MHVDVYVRHSANCKHKTIAITKTAACRKWLYIEGSRKPVSAKTRSCAQAVDTADKLRLGKTTDTQSERTVRDAVKAFLDNKEHHGCLS